MPILVDSAAILAARSPGICRGTGLTATAAVARTILPTVIGGAWMAIHDARTRTVLPSQVLAVLTAQIGWSLASGAPLDRLLRDMGLGLLAGAACLLVASLPRRPLGHGDALTSWLFASAITLSADQCQSAASPLATGIEAVAWWAFLSALCAGGLLMLEQLRDARIRPQGQRASPSSLVSSLAFVPAQYAALVLMILLETG